MAVSRSVLLFAFVKEVNLLHAGLRKCDVGMNSLTSAPFWGEIVTTKQGNWGEITTTSSYNAI